MSRDGLLPKKFSKLHPKYKTPAFSTIVTGLLVAIPALFMNLKEVTDLVSIGTLFAFVLVCGGVLKLEEGDRMDKSRFRVPFFSSRRYLPFFLAIGIYGIYHFNRAGALAFFEFTGGWEEFSHKIPLLTFLIVLISLSYSAIRKNLSLIPVLGLLTNFYLMTELGISNWAFFGVWLLLGLVVYFTYGFKKSRLIKSTI